MRGGYYRPAYLHSIKGAVDASGNPSAWRHRIVGQSIIAGTAFENFIVKDGIDGTSVEGAADLPYAIPNLVVEYHPTKVGIPVLWWRSVGHSHTAFVTECFLDELAAAGKQDPFKLRQRLLAKKPRHLGVLELAAEKAGWGKPLPKTAIAASLCMSPLEVFLRTWLRFRLTRARSAYTALSALLTAALT